MEKQDFMVEVKAFNRETGEPRIFKYPLSNVGEMLNNLVMSGYHNITCATLTDMA